MTVQDLSDYLQVPVKTVYVWNCEGGGPPRQRIGKYVRYRRSDVEAWVDAHRMP